MVGQLLSANQGLYYVERAKALDGLGRAAEAGQDRQRAKNMGVGG